MRTKQVQNSGVIAYNSKITRKFACHLIEGLCMLRTRGITYLFKCMYKRQERVIVCLVEELDNQRYDRSRKFQDVQYGSASESLLLLYKFDIGDCSPPVVQLVLQPENRHIHVLGTGKRTRSS